MQAGKPTPEANADLIRSIFADADFIRSLGIELSAFGYGWGEARLRIAPTQRQQHGFVHAGVVMTLADHTCGGAAATTMSPDKDVITVENKVAFLRPAMGAVLQCRAEVLRSGKSLVFVEGSVFGEREGQAILVARASSTLSVIDRRAGA